MSNDEENPAYHARDSMAVLEMPLPAVAHVSAPAVAEAERCLCGVVHARSGTLNCGISRYPAATAWADRMTPR